jgi:16S rRNA (guanine966-N2)-methyltransferase
MRVIGGEARGRKLYVPDLPTLRPTSDRVREAIFDVLEARGLVEGRTMLDLFAGSGALGIEALSRGAASCTFVDSDRRAVDAIEQNLASLELTSRPGERVVRVVQRDALSYLRGSGVSVEVALVDPPYRFEGWAELLRELRADHAVLEHGSPIEVTAAFHILRTYRYGGTLVTLVGRQPIDEDPA